MSKERGIDISTWQGNVDFNKVKASGIQFLILRSSYRQTVDGRFYGYVKAAKAAGIPIRGVYHFSYALDVEQAKQEAAFCISQLEAAGLGKDVIVFFDFEYDTITKAKAAGVTLGRAECNTHTEAFCEYITDKGYRAGIYSNIDYYRNMFDHDLLDKYVFWLADWSGEADYPCDFHQYTSKGVVDGIKGSVDMNYRFVNSDEKKEDVSMSYSRQAVVDLARSWIGKKESDGSYKEIIDIYNSYTGSFPRGTKMLYGWAWCAATWSALAVKLGYTAIMPIEISCYYIIEAAKRMGCWVEDDAYVPSPGDAVLYDWEDSGIGDNTGNPDHIGPVEHVSGGYITVIEGNLSNAVKRRTLSINGKFIRGFITPKYDEGDVAPPEQSEKKSINTIAHEVITGIWGNGPDRKAALTAKGYDYDEVQTRVNEILNGSATKPSTPVQNQNQPTLKKVTATAYAKSLDKGLAGIYKVTAKDGLYCRNDAGTNKKALCLIPYGTEVQCYGYYTAYNGTKWLYIRFVMDGVQYTGFSSSMYLKK